LKDLLGPDQRDDSRLALWASAAGAMILIAVASLVFGDGPDMPDPGGSGGPLSYEQMDATGEIAAEIQALRDRVDLLTAENATLSRRLGALEGSSAPAAEPVVSFTAPLYGLELGVFSDETALRRRWDELQIRQPGALAGLAGRLAERDRGDRVEYVLVAGPFADSAAAAERCDDPALAAIGCAPTLYGGNALEP
jgi:hypothetical protein